MKSWRGIYFGDLKKSTKFNSANDFLMPNVHGVKHEVKYSNGTYLCWKKKETVKTKPFDSKPLQELGLPYTAVYFKIIIAYRVSWLRANYFLTVHILTLNPLYTVDRDCPSGFAKNR